MIYFELFYTFFLIGLFTFGGGYAMIPMIEEQVVSKGWIAEATLADFALNISTFIGNNIGGVFGAICSTIGVILPSLIIIIIVAIVMNKFITNKFVRGALNGVKPIVLSLIFSTALFMLIKVVFFSGNAIGGELAFDMKSFTLLIVLVGYIIIHKFVQKKSVSPIKMLGIAALLGLIIFTV